MDTLTDVLSLVRLQSYVSGGFDAGGDWSVAFDRSEGITFYAVVSGECWLSIEGAPEPSRVATGDCLLLPRGLPFRVASDLRLPSVDVRTIRADVADGSITCHNGGGSFLSVGGNFVLARPHDTLLSSVLPAIVHIRSDSGKAVLRWCIEQMRTELRNPQPGGFLVAQQLATMLLIHALRLYLEERPNGTGWLFALGDKQMAAALNALHGDVARRWTVDALAGISAMSRTAFASKFRTTVGESPMRYLTRWRMMVAGDRLMNTFESVGSIALALGYESESAFSQAFKRELGCAPRQYARNKTGSP